VADNVERLYDEEDDPNALPSGQTTTSPSIDYWKNMTTAPTGGSGPSGFPAYGTPEWYKYFFGMDPAQSQPIIDAQKQGTEEFNAGIYGGPEGAITPAPTPSEASEPQQPATYYDQPSEPAPAPASAPVSAPHGAPGGTSISASSSSTQTPLGSTVTGGPDPYTTDPNNQDEFLKLLMSRMTQGTEIDPNDPNIRQQVAPYAAAIERQKRSTMSDMAEQAGPLASGALRGQERMLGERAGQAVGGFEADLVGRELQNRRDEIRQAMEQYGGVLDADQQRQLSRELATLDAQLKQMGISSQEGLGYAELGLKEKLGTAGLNIDLMRLLQQGQQFGDDLGFRVGDREAYWNAEALRQLLG
jgi:hypothetical protein